MNEIKGIAFDKDGTLIDFEASWSKGLSSLINSIFPNSIFLIPIREPLQHANSLLNQHLHFSQLQKEDDFIRRYMNYLGHNEFGLNHKPWNDPIHYQDHGKIDYWLEQWFLFYKDFIK